MNKTMDARRDDDEGSRMGGFRENERYKRAYLRPVAKSVYQHKKIARLTGSMNNSIRSSGLVPYDSNKILHNGGMQITMTQTFNMKVLNNSMAMANRNNALAKTVNGINQSALDENISEAELRGIRTMKSESAEAFSVISGAKIQFEKE